MKEMKVIVRKRKEVRLVLKTDFEEEHTIEEAIEVRNILTRMIGSAKTYKRLINSSKRREDSKAK